MIDEEIKTFLLTRNSRYNFTKLLDFIASTGFTYKSVKLQGLSIGLTTIDTIYLDLDKIEIYGDKMTYFVILHETAHFKRINKYGSDWLINNLSKPRIGKLIKFIINEEIIADRYACLLFNKFNNEIFPWNQTQQLNLKERELQYIPMVRLYHNKIENDINKYNELISKFIKDKND